jgi:hypothetical protein
MSTEGQQYLEQVNRELNDLDQELDGLALKAEHLPVERKQHFIDQIDAVRDERKALQKKLDEVQSAGDLSWDAVKETVDNYWNSFKEVLGQSKREFKQGYKEDR